MANEIAVKSTIDKFSVANIADGEIAVLNEIVTRNASLPVVTDDASARRTDMAVKELKAGVKAVHDRRMALTRIVDAWKKSLIAQEEAICDAANAMIEQYSKSASAYLLEKRRAEEEALAAAREAAELEAAMTGSEVAVAEESRHPVVSGVKAREFWGWEIVNPNLVPRQYCDPNPKLINEYRDSCRRNGVQFESMAIPGVKFTKEFRV